MVDGSGRFLPESKRAFPTLKISFYKLSGLSHLFPHSRRFAKYHLGHLPDKQNSEIDVLSGAYFMVSKEVLSKTGGFDERFFMYGEDIDLSYRIQQLGYKNFYLAETCIIHFKGESTRKGSMNYVKMFYKAMSLFVQKHYKGKNLAGINLLIETSIWFRAGLTATKNILHFNKTTVKNGPVHTLLIASESEKASVVPLLNRQQQNRKLVHVLPEDDWKRVIRLQATDEVIFVQGTLSYKEIIRRIQELPEGVMAGIYSNGANSIVGSMSRNTNGYQLV
jgi:hypothetical protein